MTHTSPPGTFPELLSRRLAADAAQPLITAYDDATGERTELSVTTYANWVHKTANLLTDELDLQREDTMLLALPSHWLVPVFLGAAWSTGVAVTTDPGVPHDLVVAGPGDLEGHGAPVLACSLLPFAVRFAEPLPAEVLDYGVLWPGQSDHYVAIEPVAPTTTAWRTRDAQTSQGELLAEAGAAAQAGVRLLTDLHPAARNGVPAFLGPVATGGSLVLVRHGEEAKWPARQADERATSVLRG